MKERIQQIKDRTKMTQRDFAAALGISPSSLSSIFNGHTSPTNNLVQAIHRRVPEISITWLMFGEGEMMEGDQEQTAAADNKTPAAPQIDNTRAAHTGELEFSTEQDNTGTPQNVNKEVSAAGQVIVREIKYLDKPQRQITEIRVFYDDGTYDTFPGRRD